MSDKTHTQKDFISRTTADKEWTDQFATALRDKGVQIWYDGWNLRPGDKWQDRLEDALRDSRIFCVVVGDRGAETPWTYFEIGAALADQKIIVPVLSDTSRQIQLPPMLSRYQAIGERTPVEAASRLADLVETAGTAGT